MRQSYITRVNAAAKKVKVAMLALLFTATMLASALPAHTQAATTTQSYNDTAFSYTGTWNTDTAATNAYQGDNHYSNTTNSYYQLTFTGTQAKIYTEKNSYLGIFAVSIDSGTEQMVDAYNSSRIDNTLLYTSPLLASGSHTIKVRLTGTKNVSSSNYYTTADRIDVLNTQNMTPINDSLFTYSGTWYDGGGTGTYQGDNHYTDVTNAYYQMSFTGTQAKIYTEKNTTLGIVAISIDGGTEQMVDPYNATRIDNTLIYTSPVLTPGNHTIKVRNTGTKNALSGDYFAVGDRLVVVSTVNSVSLNDPAYAYSGTWYVGNPSGAYLADNHYSNTTNGYYQVTFTGVQASLYTEKNVMFGKQAISIDGGAEQTVDAYNSTRLDNTLIYTSPVLTPGTHTIKSRITGTKNASSSDTYATADRVEVNTDAGSAMPSGVAGNWSLTFDDEFNGSSLDTSRWSAMEGNTVNNVTTHASNVSVSGGNLVLTLASSTSGAEVSSGPGDGAGSNGYYLPIGGYAEARVYFPGSGSTIYNWPAWWTSGANWPSAGEHDIAEGLGTMTTNYHSPSGAHNFGTISGTWSNAFHTYGIYRKATSADVYYDGTLVKSYSTDDNSVGHSLLLNVGSGNTAVYGTGSQVKVDYVRVWEQ